MRMAFTVSFVGLGAASVAMGAVLPPDLDGFRIDIGYEGGGWSTALDPSAITDVTPDPQKPGRYEIVGAKANGAFDSWWEMDVDIDPFVTSSFNIVNITNAPQAFTITVTLPIVPQLPVTSAIGSISGSLLDSDDSGFSQIVNDGAFALYEALIDGVTVEEMYSSPFDFNTNLPTANLPTQTFGPQLEAGANATIAIRNTFVLSPGDTFQAVSYFFINAIPAPGSLAIFAGAGVVAARRRR